MHSHHDYLFSYGVRKAGTILDMRLKKYEEKYFNNSRWNTLTKVLCEIQCLKWFGNNSM